ncbi:MAG: alpha/beta hydrolase [Actinomycetia bacterium]|nr:alpha/beta hydrolase [Actinomycetes bacterium]
MSSPTGTTPTKKVRIPSTGGVELAAHLAVPDEELALVGATGVIFCHGFPSGEVWAERIGADLPALADRSAEQMGWTALAVRFRGCGASSGDFSLQGWIDDIAAAGDFVHREQHPEQIWLCGFGTGGAVSLVAAAEDYRINGVVAAGSPADFDDWAANPNRLLAHARRVGAIKSPSFPSDVNAWKAELSSIEAVRAVELLPPRPLLVLHGADDEVVPHFDARLMADAHGDAELRVIRGGGHQLRHDPRALAVLLGWIARQQANLRGREDRAGADSDRPGS